MTQTDRHFLTIPAVLDPRQNTHGIALARAFPATASAPSPPVGLSYVFMVFTNRCGSNYLGDILATTGFFNYPGEWLNAELAISQSQTRGFASFAEYFFVTAAEEARNGYFVVKASIGQLAILAAYGILGPILTGSSFVAVERMDKLAQAISWQVAVQTGRYTSLHEPGNAIAPVYDRAVIAGDISGIAQQIAATSLFMGLNGIRPLHLTYEFISAYPAFAGDMLCDFLGQPDIRCRPERTTLRRQATDLNAAWRERFLRGE